MALVVYQNPKGKRRSTLTIQVGKVDVTLKLMNVDGSDVLAAEIDDDAVLAHLRGTPGFLILNLDAPSAPTPARPPTVLPVSVEVALLKSPDTGDGSWSMPPIVQQALDNGWSYWDVTGAGNKNQWGVEGGRSERTGLTMAEMSISIPPEGWDKAAATSYPWQVAGWRPPGVDWKAPTVPSKASRAEPPPPAGPAEELEDAPDMEQPEGTGEGAAAPPVRRVASPAGTRGAEILAGFEPEQVTAMVALLGQLWSEDPDRKPPSVNKANFRLKKANLPTVKEAQLQALLDQVPNP